MAPVNPTANQEPRDAFTRLIHATVAGDQALVDALLTESPALAQAAAGEGATRASAKPFFFEAISHYLYAGDTALHLAAAGYQVEIARVLLAGGANVQAVNRRGASPLHYATDGGPGSAHWNAATQAAVIQYLLEAGADVNAADKSGVSPLHRAVRTRCAKAVEVLLAQGADSMRPNGAGSTPLHLAVQTTGRGGSGSAEAQEQQRQIIRALLQAGAKPSEKAAGGKSARECAKAAWIIELLDRDP